jgi:signal transduction histidine kinase
MPEIAKSRAIDQALAERSLSLIAGHLQGAPAPNFATFSSSDLVLFAHLLDELRAAILGPEEMDPAQAVATLALLRDVEDLRRRMHVGNESHEWVTLLSALRGPELLVEMAHDLRSPLTSILFLSETLRDGHSGGLNDLQHQQLGIIYSAALSMVTMAGDVIELVQGTRSLIDREPVPFSLSHTFESIFDLVRPMLQTRKIVLRHRTPEVDDRLGLPVALNRVVLNLTTNAIRHTKEGFVELTATEVGDDRVEFSVRDTGSGLDSEALPQLFKAFQTDGASPGIGFSGAGLGLSICRRLIEGMGGDLDLETSPGWGTRFFFTLHLPRAPRE